MHDYALFMLTGLACWTFVASALPNSSMSMLSNANLIRKVRFPRQLVPLSVVGTQVVAFSAMLVVVGIVNAIRLPGNRLWECSRCPSPGSSSASSPGSRSRSRPRTFCSAT